MSRTQHQSEEPCRPVRRIAQWLARPRILVWLALVVAAVSCRPWVCRQLSSLESREEYRLTAHDIHVTEPPHRPAVEFVQSVLAQSRSARNPSILAPQLTQRLARAFSRQPWVAKVVSVRKRPARQVIVELKYREPVAAVRMNSGIYPIDAESVLLPPRDFAPVDTESLLPIANIRSLPAGSAGEVWGDPIVAGAAGIAEILSVGDGNGQPLWKRLGVSSIHGPSPAEGVMPYQLVTDRGSRIIWGRAPSVTHPGELSPQLKVARLEKYFHDFGSFDGTRGPLEIDIRHWQEISRRAIASETNVPRG